MMEKFVRTFFCRTDSFEHLSAVTWIRGKFIYDVEYSGLMLSDAFFKIIF